MIKRINDYNVFSDNELDKIASAVKKSESKKLYDTYEDRNKAHIVKAELEIQGLKAEVFNMNGKYHVYATTLESVELSKAEESGQFKKLAWGRYSFQRESAIGEFNFDDGSIWKLSTDENGNSVLVKEVSDEDEDEVVRGNTTKTASLTKQASIYAADSNISAMIQMIYDEPINNSFLSDLIQSGAKQGLYDMLDQKLDVLVNKELSSAGIDDQATIGEIKGLISSSLGNQITNEDSLENFISTYVDQQLNKVGSQRKYFTR